MSDKELLDWLDTQTGDLRLVRGETIRNEPGSVMLMRVQHSPTSRTEVIGFGDTVRECLVYTMSKQAK